MKNRGEVGTTVLYKVPDAFSVKSVSTGAPTTRAVHLTPSSQYLLSITRKYYWLWLLAQYYAICACAACWRFSWRACYLKICQR